jgi:hypothetical protein
MTLYWCYAGTIYVRWPQMCQHFNWGDHKKLCGPCITAFNQKRMEEHCARNHTLGCDAHKPPMVKGEKFEIRKHFKDLTKLKLTETRDELKAEKDADKKPPGAPKKVNGADVYPTRSFA